MLYLPQPHSLHGSCRLHRGNPQAALGRVSTHTHSGVQVKILLLIAGMVVHASNANTWEVERTNETFINKEMCWARCGWRSVFKWLALV